MNKERAIELNKRVNALSDKTAHVTALSKVLSDALSDAEHGEVGIRNGLNIAWSYRLLANSIRDLADEIVDIAED